MFVINFHIFYFYAAIVAQTRLKWPSLSIFEALIGFTVKAYLAVSGLSPFKVFGSKTARTIIRYGLWRWASRNS